jgi:peptidoglycan/xylan/chitin deacetylase (PgdA/CDA1 family)
MVRQTIDRKSRRRKRTGLWLLLVLGPIFLPLNFNFPGTSTWAPWLVIPILVIIAGHRWMKDEGGVPVITYHSVSEGEGWLPLYAKASVTPETFDRQLRMLRDMGCNVIPNRDLMNARKKGLTLPDRPVVLHFDDGYLDNWTAAYPILKRHKMPATVFASADFIEDGEKARSNLEDERSGAAGRHALKWMGYLNWPELRALDESGLVDVQSHGTDHARVRTGPNEVDRLTPANWRDHAWMQWALMEGNKSKWFHGADPPCVPYGTSVYESGPALASLSWSEGGLESRAEYEARVTGALERSRSVLEAGLQKKIDVFCWPYNRATPAGRDLAELAGYAATTGGKGENRAEEDRRVISRMSVRERTLGFRWGWADRLAFRARVRLGHGNYYWYLPLLAFKVVGFVTKPLFGGRTG